MLDSAWLRHVGIIWLCTTKSADRPDALQYNDYRDIREWSEPAILSRDWLRNTREEPLSGNRCDSEGNLGCLSEEFAKRRKHEKQQDEMIFQLSKHLFVMKKSYQSSFVKSGQKWEMLELVLWSAAA